MKAEQKINQLQEISSKLSVIYPQLVKGDIKNCAEELGVTPDLIGMYLKGNGQNPDTGIRIASHFNRILEERSEAAKKL